MTIFVEMNNRSVCETNHYAKPLTNEARQKTNWLASLLKHKPQNHSHSATPCTLNHSPSATPCTFRTSQANCARAKSVWKTQSSNFIILHPDGKGPWTTDLGDLWGLRGSRFWGSTLSGYRIWNLQSAMWNLKSEISNLKSEIWNLKSEN